MSLRDPVLVVVGARSYIGVCLVEHARRHGADVVAVASRDCDFRQADQVRILFDRLRGRSVSVVFLAVVNKSVANDFDAYSANVTIVRNLAEGLRRAPWVESLIYFSSVDVYGNHPAVPITEKTTIDPDTWYGLAKYCSEWMLGQAGGIDIPVTVLRIPGVYGAAANDRSVIGRFVEGIRQDGRVVIAGGGAVLRDYVFVGDVGRLVEALLPLRYDGVLNVATGRSLPLVEIVRRVGRALGTDVRVAHGPSDDARAFDLVFDVTRLRGIVPGFEFTDLEDGVGTYSEAPERQWQK